MHRRLPAVVAAVLLPGCVMAAHGPTPEGLSYRVPDPDPATYTFTDTAVFTIESALGPMEVVTGQAGTAELDFRRWRSDGHVVVRFLRFRGSFRNATQGASTVDESDIGGPFTVRLDPAGRVVVTDTPSLSGTVLDIAGPEGLVRPLFVQLPGRAVGSNAQWVDTITTLEEVAGTRSAARSVITSTLAGDTVVAGRRLLRIRTRSVNTVEVTGVSGGVEVEQRLSGTTVGTVLWDDGDHLLVERSAAGALEGTLALPGAGVEPMAVRAEIRRRVTLRN